MKKKFSVKAVIIALVVISFIQLVATRLQNVTILSIDSSFTTIGNSLLESVVLKGQRERLQAAELDSARIATLNIKQEIEIASLRASTPEIVFEGMTMNELAAKLDASLHSDLSGYGASFAKYSIEYGVDPYLAVAISLHETGCVWTCSALVRNKNNVGGMRGNGGWLSFESLDAGIEAMIRNLSRNYIAYGLTTPEAIGPKYAMSATWAEKINNYIYKIRNA